MISKEQLDRSLEAWAIAQESALHEQKAWATILQNHSTLIASLRANGHSWANAQAEFDKFSEEHRKRLLATWEAMDARCKEYRELLEKFKTQ